MSTEVKGTEEVSRETKKISLVGIKADLKAGATRYKKDDFGNGSIEEKYGLTKAQVARLFKDERLKGLKTKGKTRLKTVVDLVDDETTV